MTFLTDRPTVTTQFIIGEPPPRRATTETRWEQEDVDEAVRVLQLHGSLAFDDRVKSEAHNRLQSLQRLVLKDAKWTPLNGETYPRFIGTRVRRVGDVWRGWLVVRDTFIDPRDPGRVERTADGVQIRHQRRDA